MDRGNGWLTVQPGGQVAAAMEPAEASAEWSTRKYLFVFAVVGVPALAVLFLGFLLGQIPVAGILAGLPFALLILWRPEIGIYLIVLYIPFEVYGIVGPGVATLTKVLGIYTAIVLLIHLIGRRRVELRTPVFWVALLFTTWSVLTIVWSSDAFMAWRDALRRIQMVGLMFVVIAACATRERAMTLLWMMFLAAVLAAIGARFLSPRVEYVWEVERSTIGAAGANHHAKDLLPGIFLAPFLWSQTRRWGRVLIVLAGLYVLADIILTVSRSVYVAVFVAVIVAVMSYRRVSAGRRLLLSAGVVAALVMFFILGVITGLWGEGTARRFGQVWQHGTLVLGGREVLWGEAIKMGVAHPLTGVGVGNYVIEMLQRVAVTQAERAVHNDFLTHFAETGFPGLVMYLTFLGMVFWEIRRVRIPLLHAGLMGLFAAAVVASMGNPSYGLKGFWLQMTACAIAGTFFSHEGFEKTTDAGRGGAALGAAGLRG